MAINKNFVVKNGLEVNTSLLVADFEATTNGAHGGVGIGTTLATHTLQVTGGIGCTHLLVTGVATFNQNIKVGGISTFTGIGTFGSDVFIDGTLTVAGVQIDGGSTIGTDVVTRNLNVSGFSTLTKQVAIGGSIYHDNDTDRNSWIGFTTFVNANGIVTSFTVNTSGEERVRVDPGGFVGIGTTNPNTMLDVGGSLSLSKNLQLNVLRTLEDGKFQILRNAEASDQPVITIEDAGTTGGFVGIGSTDPTRMLDVGGEVRIGAGLTVVGVSSFLGFTTFFNNVEVNGNLDVHGDLSYDEVNGRNLRITGIATFANEVGIADSIYHTGDTDTSIRFPGDGIFDVDIDSTRELRVTGAGITVTGMSTVAGVSTFFSQVFIGEKLVVSGISTFTSDIDVDGHTELDDLNVTGVSTFGNTVAIGDSIIHVGDTDTSIRFPSADTFTIETGGDEEFRVTGAGVTIAGISTVVGFATFFDQVFIGGDNSLVVVGFSTFSSDVDINASIDVDGHTELDDVSVSGILTAASTTESDDKDTGSLVVEGGAGIEKHLNVGAGASITGIATANSFRIGNTQVISNARQLQNIESLDATTTATIESAIESSPNKFDSLLVTGISTFTGIATFGSGVGIADSIFHIDDTDTSIRFPANGVFAVDLDATERMRVIPKSGVAGFGSVGIGTNLPEHALVVRDTGLARIRIRNDVESSENYASLNLKTAGFDNGWSIYSEFNANDTDNYLKIFKGDGTGTHMYFKDPNEVGIRSAFYHVDANGDDNGNSCFGFTVNSAGIDTGFKVKLDGATRFIVESDARTGIGTTDPTIYNTNADDLVIYGAGHQGLTIRSGSAHDGSIMFNDTNDTNQRGIIRYDHTTDALRFHNSSGELVAMDAAQVGIGTTLPSAKLHIEGNSDSGDTACQLRIEDTDTDSGSGIPSIQFAVNATNTGRIRGTDTDGITFATGNSNTDRWAIDPNGNSTLAGIVSFTGTGAIHVPDGTTGERPDPAVNGYFRYNTTDNQFEGYADGAWGAIAGGGGGVTEVDTNVSTTSATGVGSFAITSHRSASVIAQIDQGAGNYQVGRYLMIHDGATGGITTTATLVEESSVSTTDAQLASYTVRINSLGNCELMVNMVSAGLATVTTKIDTVTV